MIPIISINQAPQQARDLAIYIHWPFCLSKCPYCDFNSHVRSSVDQPRWREALLTELSYMAERTRGQKVRSVFFGGGTPSLMPAQTVSALIDRMQALWPVAPDVEITCEANPTSAEASVFRDFKAAGVGRISLGVQALDDAALRFLGRGHSASEALKALEMAASIFPRYSFDLIYARPGQTPDAWASELERALGYTAGHLSLYQLTIEPGTAFAHAYRRGDVVLPDEETAAALYTLTGYLVGERGLHAYEVSNYARPGEESRHNLAYWQGDDYVGIGPGAHGRIRKERIATATLKSPERWLESVENNGHGLENWQTLARADDAAERLMMGMRLASGIDYAAFQAKTGYDLRDYLRPEKIAFYTQAGLLENTPNALRATPRGRLLLTSLTAELIIDPQKTSAPHRPV